MDRITRKTLKQDRFATEVTESVEYIAEHRRQAMLYGGIVVAVVALALGIYFFREYRTNRIHQLLATALETEHGVVSDQEVPGRPSFRTAQEKNTRALHQFEDLAREYPRSAEGQIARYYIGLVYFDMGRAADAEKQLERVGAEGSGGVPSLARFALAEVYLSERKDDDARKVYEALLKNPTDMVPQSRVQLALADYWRSRNPSEARKILLQLVRSQGPVSGAAGNMLRELGAQ
jgi:predicted negative regulator of RcsB-dependent stress response